jgi:hypothetical protein
MKTLAGIVLALMVTTQARANDTVPILLGVITGVAVYNIAKDRQAPQTHYTPTTNYAQGSRHPNQQPIYDHTGRLIGHTWAGQSQNLHPAVIYNSVERARMFADPHRGGQYLRENLEMGRLPRW